MKIQNIDQLAKTDLRRAALEIAEEGYRAIDTKEAIRQWVRMEGDTLRIMETRLSLKDVDRLFVVGIGKCSLDAAQELERILGDRIADGLVIDLREGELARMRVIAGEHPYPTEKNIDATRQLIELLEGLTRRDAVIMIVSGGGSTLLCQPDNFTCQDETALLRYFYDHGASIYEINTVRKHLSRARGGFLARHAYPAQVISLIFSDVPGDNMEFIASGPTVRDTTTKEDAGAILDKYSEGGHAIFDKAHLIETPKDAVFFSRTENVLFICNVTALDAMAKKAEALGFHARIVNAALTGEARDTGIYIAKEITGSPAKTALLFGGETTVTVTHPGKGGRCLELALAALGSLGPDALVMPLASDGRDNTEYAGAISDIITKENAGRLGLDPVRHLNENQSFSFFEKTGDQVMTGVTGSNVSDLIIALRS